MLYLFLPQNSLSIESEWIPQNVKLLPFGLTLGGAITAYLVNLVFTQQAFQMKTHWLGREIYLFLNKRWLFDKVYNEFIAKPVMKFGYHVSFKALDKGAIEMVGPFGIIVGMQALIKEVSKFQSGFLYHYALMMLIGVTFLISLVGLSPVLSFWVDPRLYFVFLLSFVFFLFFTPEKN